MMRFWQRVFTLLSLVWAVWGSLATTSLAQGEFFVDEIEIIGVTQFDEEAITAVLETSPGDRLERAQVMRSGKNLELLYQQEGYFSARVRSELVKRKRQGKRDRYILKFLVTEGPPTRIASVELNARNIEGSPFESMWKEIRPELISRVLFPQGERYRDELITEGSRSIETALAQEEFVGSKVASVVKTPVPAPSGVESEKVTSGEAQWVHVTFVIEMGDRVTFGFRGNQRFSLAELSEEVDEQRIVGFGTDYIASIRKRILERYYQVGYANVQVTYKTFENLQTQEKRVTFYIEEGERVEIESIRFDGNFVFSQDDLLEYFYKNTVPLVERGYFVASEIEKTTGTLIDWIRSQGYLFSRLITISHSYSEDRKRVRILIYLYEGEQTLVGEINLSGVQNIPKPEVQRILGLQVQEPLDIFAFNEGLDALKTEYRARGYLGMQILNEQTDKVVQYSQRNRIADIFLDVKEGPQYRASQITIEGLRSTEEIVVRRELRFTEGDILEEGKIIESERRLRKLGIFAKVKIQYRDDPERVGFKEIRVVIEEGTPGRVGGGVGFRNDLGVRVFGEIAYTNLWGSNHTWSLSGNANRRLSTADFCSTPEGVYEQVTVTKTDDNGNAVLDDNGNVVTETQDGPPKVECFAEFGLQMGYVWPYFLLPELNFRPAVRLEKRRFSSLHAETRAASMRFDRRLLEEINLVGALTYQIEQIRQFNAQSEEDNQTLRIGSITPSIRLDLRDDPLSPRKGFFSAASYEFASSALGSQRLPFPVGYQKIQVRADQFIPLSRDTTWYISVRTGYALNTINPQKPGSDEVDTRIGVPLIKQFRLGGPGSLRGYKVGEVGPSRDGARLDNDDISIAGTQSFINYRTQLDLPFAGPMRFGPFFDAANNLVDRYSVSQDMLYSAGFGFHYSTPVGPVNFDLGFKLNPERNDSGRQEFHFTIGIL